MKYLVRICLWFKYFFSQKISHCLICTYEAVMILEKKNIFGWDRFYLDIAYYIVMYTIILQCAVFWSDTYNSRYQQKRRAQRGIFTLEGPMTCAKSARFTIYAGRSCHTQRISLSDLILSLQICVMVGNSKFATVFKSSHLDWNHHIFDRNLEIQSNPISNQKILLWPDRGLGWVHDFF